jgi:membrane protein DedA with SNARE-associated domain
MRVGRGRVADLVCGAAIVVCQGWSALSNVLIPGWLGTRPVLLELLNGSALSIAAGGAFARVGHASLTAALLAPLPLWLSVDVVSWWTGHHFGPAAADWLVRHRPASKRAVERCERLIDRYGILSVMLAPWLPLPTVLMYAANGWRRLPLLVFVVTDAMGTLLRAAVMLLIGYASGGAAVGVLREVSAYSAWLTGAVIACLLGIVFRQARKLSGGRVDHGRADLSASEHRGDVQQRADDRKT